MWALIGWTADASAHPSPFSYIDIDVKPDGVYCTLVAHVLDVAHDVPLSPPERLFDRQVLSDNASRIYGLLGPRLRIRAGGLTEPQWTGIEPLRRSAGDQAALRLSRGQCR